MESELLKNILEAVRVLKGGKLENIQSIASALNYICTELGFDSEEQAIVFVVILDRQSTYKNSDLDAIANYLKITAMDMWRFVPAIQSLISRGYLIVENKGEALISNKKFLIYHEVVYAILHGRKFEISMLNTADDFNQINFCNAVGKLRTDRSKHIIETQKLFFNVQGLEEEHPNLELVAHLKSTITDIESRTLFYDMCNDYSTRLDGTIKSDIDATLVDIYESVVDQVRVKKTILNGTNQLIVANLIRRYGRNKIRLTNKGIRLLFGENAEAMLVANKAADRYEFVKQVYKIVDSLPNYYPSGVEQEGMYDDLLQLEDDNEELSVVKRVKAHVSELVSRLLFYLIANELVDGKTYAISRFAEICSRGDEVKLKGLFKDGSHSLIQRQLVEVIGNGMFDSAQLALTENGKELFLEEDLYLFEPKIDSKDLIQPDSIRPKQLYFDESLQRQLSTLEGSLDESKYQQLTQRLADRNMPQGVAVLLYGHPGTGKTESVMQIARATGRTVVHVDISATKTCWFGESEKLIKEVFVKYRKLCENSKLKPILLFNEADAVFAKRKDSESSNVAQTENAIQNIILEELERLDGILIATTNRADNLDRAFERRFLFKIRFDRPSLEAKQSIWKSKIPALSISEAQMLAARYDFSGGEIENISRKVIINEIIEGGALSIENIITLCEEEKISNRTAKVGF